MLFYDGCDNLYSEYALHILVVSLSQQSTQEPNSYKYQTVG